MASFLLQKIEPADDTGTTTGVVHTDILPPSTYDWAKEDISASKAGRTANYAMKKMLVGKADVLNLSWRGRSYAEIATLLQMFDYEYAWITYISALTGGPRRRLFYMSGMKTSSFRATNGGVWESASVTCIQAIPDPP